MDGNDASVDYVIAELLGMGFEISKAVEATKAVGPCLDNAVEFLLNSSCKNNNVENLNHIRSSNLNNCSVSQGLGKRTLSSFSRGHLKQSSLSEHLHFLDKVKRGKSGRNSDVSASFLDGLDPCNVEVEKLSVHANCKLEPATKESQFKLDAYESSNKSESTPKESSNSQSFSLGTQADWEEKVSILLQQHFGISSLRSFQQEALDAWLANQDCLVLAATGSGKSLCFQLPALLSGKVVVVISPLISLMHDQCLKLAKHGISACFLGSGQTDSSVERKAMDGMYGVVYVCPETILRLIEPLQRLAGNHGIALFAIDEVHCISKWGHDFRPDYRRLSVLRENFKACNLKSIEYDIPLMALTATATVNVREDILKSLHMSMETKIVLTTFFRPNLRFSVKDSRTSHVSSYERDFRELIDTYTSKTTVGYSDSSNILPDSEESDCCSRSADDSTSDVDEILFHNSNNYDDENDGHGDEARSGNGNIRASSKENQLSVEFLEDELDNYLGVDDLDVACGEFGGNSLAEYGSSGTLNITTQPEKVEANEPLGHGPTIIYVPTRKETLKLAKYLCRFGVKAAAYHAKLPKAHLRRVHDEFHQDIVQVVVATIAFGMGIDKSNVRRIIHYGWPQSLEAYYQEAGRAGRDGKLAECTLYADLSRIPTLLPSKRSEEQTKQAYKILSDCYRYGMATASCRAKMLVNYFGEDFGCNTCLLCDICVGGPPELQNMKAEADAFMQILAAHYLQNQHHVNKSLGLPAHSCSYDDGIYGKVKTGRYIDRPNIKLVICRIREQFPKLSVIDLLWWRGLACILLDNGLIKEGDDVVRVCIKFPDLTDLGVKFLESADEDFYAYPRADMLLSKQFRRPYSTFSEWGGGWADPEIHRQRLQRKKYGRKLKKRWSKHGQDLGTAWGRIKAKLSKPKC